MRNAPIASGASKPCVETSVFNKDATMKMAVRIERKIFMGNKRAKQF